MNPIPPELYIGNQLRNDVLIFEIKDPELTLYHDSKEEPYTGFIRTYYMDIYNIEARFKDGKIRRIRYWHPNRQLAMDADFVSGSGQAWTSTGALSVSWNKEEMFLGKTKINGHYIQKISLSKYIFNQNRICSA